MCGADVGEVSGGDGGEGSSPRVRGRRFGWGGVFVRAGLIPACAGQTRRGASRLTPPTAHPRVCGADCPASEMWWPLRGSSPRVRGRRPRHERRRDPHGLIPACAGQTFPILFVLLAVQAHPRVCGADDSTGYAMEIDGGSSPRVRGRLSTRRRLIPPVRAHPRVCGADDGHTYEFIGGTGSSPRVRGRHPARAPGL